MRTAPKRPAPGTASPTAERAWEPRLVRADGVVVTPTPKEPPTGLSPQMHWSEWWAYLKTTHFADRKPRYVALLTLAADKFAEATGDPPVGQIDHAMCAAFVAWLKARTWRGKAIAKRTQARFCRDVQILLDLAGPRSRDHRAAVLDEGLFGEDRFGRPRESPWVERPKLGRLRAKRGWETDECELILDACRQATVPTIAGVEPPAWWRSLFRWLWNVGTRIETTLLLTWDMLTPEAKGRGWWLDIPAAILKQGDERISFVNPEGYQAALAIRTDDPKGRLFPWDLSLNHWHYIRREKIMPASGIPRERYLGHGAHAFRRRLATNLSKKAGVSVASKQLGHMQSSTTEDSYEELEVIVEPLLHLPQPGEIQRRLFE